VDKQTIDELASKLTDALPGELAENLHELRSDIESNFRSLLNTGLDKMDLVTREEFEVQRKVLERTRAKIDQLEQELQQLQTNNCRPKGS